MNEKGKWKTMITEAPSDDIELAITA